MEPNQLVRLLYLRLTRYIILRHDYRSTLQNIKLPSCIVLLRSCVCVLINILIVIEYIKNIVYSSIITGYMDYTCQQLFTAQIQNRECISGLPAKSHVNREFIVREVNEQPVMQPPVSYEEINESNSKLKQVGGGTTHLEFEIILPFIPIEWQHERSAKYTNWKYSDHIEFSNFTADMVNDNIITLPCFIPFNILCSHLTLKNAKNIAKIHGIEKCR